jgi:transcriptional regulator with XRE-family HTH domain
MSRSATRQVLQRAGFAAKLHEALGERTSEDFARELGVTLRTVQRWRSGEGEPRAAELVRLAELLGRDPAWFYADHDHPKAAA